MPIRDADSLRLARARRGATEKGGGEHAKRPQTRNRTLGVHNQGIPEPAWRHDIAIGGVSEALSLSARVWLVQSPDCAQRSAVDEAAISLGCRSVAVHREVASVCPVPLPGHEDQVRVAIDQTNVGT